MAANEIHPTAILECEVLLGCGNVVSPYAVLLGPLELGDENEVGAHAVIRTRGDELSNRRYDTGGKRIAVGSRNSGRDGALPKPISSRRSRRT